MGGNEMGHIVVYAILVDPPGNPGQYVVRRYFSGAFGVRHEPQPYAVAETLDDARGAVPRGLAKLMPTADDHPSVVETYV